MQSDQLSLATVLDRWSGESGEHRRLAAIINALAEAGVRLAKVIAMSGLKAPQVELTQAPGETNASGDQQKPLDVYAEKVVMEALAGLDVRAVCSEESEDPIEVTASGSYVVAIDPVDGSSNIDVNAPIGTIFSILPSLGPDADPNAALLQPGTQQLAAGMIIYGPATVLVLTLGAGTDIYFLDEDTHHFRLGRTGIQLPQEANEYAINASNARHWGVGIAEYIGDLVRGKDGPLEQAFNMRWLASLVAEAYRILTRGGIFLYPADKRVGYENGRIRLVYEANPISFLVTQAGGKATNGVDDILELVPSDLHQRVPFVFGSAVKVERVRRYLTDPNLKPSNSPLFSSRGLFRD